jgi:hypothetical protein
VQIDDTVLKISAILRKARNIKNRLAPINQLPPETLALTATFLVKQRDLINATTVCQQWRTTLLSFPRLWHKAGGSASELEAYLERSGSVPIKVNLSSPHLFASITSHTSRLVALTMCVDDSSDFDRIATHLCHSVPTLRSLEIITRNPILRTLELRFGLRDSVFLHLKKLSLNGISSFRAFHPFPHITELFLCTSAYAPDSTITLLNTLGQLPGLEKVYATFHNSWDTEIGSDSMVTLPRVQEMCLSAVDVNVPTNLLAVPPILRFLKLPKVTSLTVRQSPSLVVWGLGTLPVTSFGEHLPNYVDLPDLRIHTTAVSGKVLFQSSSQAIFTYHTGPLQTFWWEARFWGGLPLCSVQRVIAILVDPVLGSEDVWLVDLIEDLKSLEVLELGGDCGHVLRRLRRRVARGTMWVNIKTLIVRGGEYAKFQAFKFESIKDSLGWHQTTVTYIPDPEVREGLAPDPDVESLSDEEDSDEGEGEDSDEDGGEDSDEDGGNGEDGSEGDEDELDGEDE